MVKLKPDLENEGTIVELSPADNHEGHVEAQIKVVKERVRCITHSLSYVMRRALLIAYVLYCVSRMNFVTTRNSTDNISPFEKFYNRKSTRKNI